MKHLIVLLVILATSCSSAFACGSNDAICELMHQVESGSTPLALERVEALAKTGSLKAQLMLGLLYAAGKGVPQDDAKALPWLLQAAHSGNPTAQSLVGGFYAAGRAGPIDLVEAKKWYELAAIAGDPGAQLMLGISYARGQGSPLNYSAAYLWFSLASLGGESDSEKYRDMARLHLSPSEREAVEEKVKTWKPVRREP
ncbi:tetratricopeptide repeat protein [Thiobacillus sp.]|uniref:tetratricopeptide repeat protein n=1 Tax=Thiobacillus sp. TaxID=924 RepID=UPI0025F233D1|nr:tetratricopeptide repeat protein [Thiobacillus sp.]MBT9540014.1 sel1 repeat family protein [Thiobacillus sp.]